MGPVFRRVLFNLCIAQLLPPRRWRIYSFPSPTTNKFSFIHPSPWGPFVPSFFRPLASLSMHHLEWRGLIAQTGMSCQIGRWYDAMHAMTYTCQRSRFVFLLSNLSAYSAGIIMPSKCLIILGKNSAKITMQYFHRSPLAFILVLLTQQKSPGSVFNYAWSAIWSSVSHAYMATAFNVKNKFLPLLNSFFTNTDTSQLILFHRNPIF